MEQTISKLKNKLEELKKRLKLISSAQSNQTALVSIKDYFITIQEYLDIIDKNYCSHIQECSSHTTSISDLQSQIAEINLKLQNLPTGEIDTTELQNSINLLQTSLEQLQADFNELTANSDTTISQIANDISDLQTEVGIINDYISAHEEDFAHLNTKLDAIDTNINNLTTAQNGLQSTQNTLTNNLNNVENRLSNAEENINALTGGVDVSGLDNRITELENVPPTFNVVDSKEITINQTITPSTEKTIKKVMFHCNCYDKAYVKFKLKYSVSGTNIIKLKFFCDTTLLNTVEVNPSEHPTEFMYEQLFSYNGCCPMFKINISASNTIKLDSIKVDLFCKNASYIDYTPEYEAYCFNNEIYLTKTTANSYDFGKYTMDNISLDNFQYSIPFTNDNNIFIRLSYVPIPLSNNGFFESVRNSIITEDNECYLKEYSNFDDSIENMTQIRSVINNKQHYAHMPSFLYDYAYLYIYNKKPTIFFPYGDRVYNQFKNLASFKDGGWSFITPVINNRLSIESSCIELNDIMAICLNEDGYFYFFPEFNLSYILKLHRGQYATAYLQGDDSINVYITNNNKTYVYKLQKDNTGKYIAQYISSNSYLYTFELLNGKALKKSSSKWQILNI